RCASSPKHTGRRARRKCRIWRLMRAGGWRCTRRCSPGITARACERAPVRHCISFSPMAYKPLDLKITPGGLNLLAPGDQVAEGDCLDLTGFWPGAAGKLEQAPGYTHLSTAHLTNSFDGLC